MFNVMLAATATGNEWMSTIIMLVIFIAIFWFLIIRPQKKKDQEAKDMQNSLANGDKITTIGGIVGTVRSVKDDTIVIETGSDKSKIVVKKWAVGSVDSKKDDKKEDKKADKKAEKEDTKAEVETEATETTEE